MGQVERGRAGARVHLQLLVDLAYVRVHGVVGDVQRAAVQDIEAIANELRLPLKKIGLLRTSEIQVSVEGTPFRVARVARAFAERLLNLAPEAEAKIEYFGYTAA